MLVSMCTRFEQRDKAFTLAFAQGWMITEHAHDLDVRNDVRPTNLVLRRPARWKARVGTRHLDLSPVSEGWRAGDGRLASWQGLLILPQ